MEAAELLSQVHHGITVQRVFGEPIERGGVTVIPVARVQGGGGGGDKQVEQRGQGAGFGLSARPAGVYVIRGDRVSWQPAVDINRIALGAQIVAVVLLLTARSLARSLGRA